MGVFAALGEALECLVDKAIELRKENGIDSWLINDAPLTLVLYVFVFIILIGVVFSHVSMVMEWFLWLGGKLLNTADCWVSVINDVLNIIYPSG